METLYATIISSAIIICLLIYVIYCSKKLKEQNDLIYGKKLEKDRLIEKCKRIAEEKSDEWLIGIPTNWTTEKASTLIDIKNLGMSARLFRCLNAAEIEWLAQVKQYSKKEILAFRNFGKKSLDELENLMNEHNLKFKK